MIIGYDITGPDNRCHIYFEAAGLQRCAKCGFKLEQTYVNPDLRIRPRTYDFSSTYDNCLIVSRRFKEFCVRFGYTEVICHPLPSDKDFYFLEVKNIIPFDVERGNIRFSNYCDECGNFESITPAYPVFLKNVVEPLKDGFYRTDLVFASGDEKEPLIIVGVETYEKLKREKFHGLYFEAVES